MYLLDSDVCINLMKGKLPATLELMKQSDPALFGVPSIVEAELRTGARKSDHPKKNLLLLEAFLGPYKKFPFDSQCAVAYANARTELERRGCPIGPNDLLIAATALASNAVLITHNVRKFKRVPGLSIEDWDEVPFD